MADEPTGELAVIDSPEQMIAAIRGQVRMLEEDPEQTAVAIMERILSADSPEKVLGGGQPLHAKDVIGRPLELRALRLMRSRYQEGPGVFAVLEGTFLDDGEEGTVTCSGRNVMAQAIMLYKLGALPRKVVIRQATEPTSSGFYPLWLESAV